MTSAPNRFAPGTFSPDPRPAKVPAMLAAQFGLELKLLLRNGEQLLLTMFIPITLLVGLTLLPLGSFGQHRAATFTPVIMALAVISTAFTGQAIAVAFDRRYGALKRLGATPLPVWGIIAGKSLAVVTVVFLQAILLGAIGFALGWRPAPTALALGAAVIALGTVAFAALGSAKLAAVPAMRAKAEHVGFSVSAYRRIGFAEVLAVIGLLVGAFVPVAGALAAAGLLVLLGGAVVAHLRNGDGMREIVPAVVLGLVTLSFLLLVVGDLRRTARSRPGPTRFPSSSSGPAPSASPPPPFSGNTASTASSWIAGTASTPSRGPCTSTTRSTGSSCGSASPSSSQPYPGPLAGCS